MTTVPADLMSLLERSLGVHRNNWLMMVSQEDLVNCLTHVLMRQRLPDLSKRASELVREFDSGVDEPWGRAVCEILQLVAYMPVGSSRAVRITKGPDFGEQYTWLLNWLLTQGVIVREEAGYRLVEPTTRRYLGHSRSLEGAIRSAIGLDDDDVEEQEVDEKIPVESKLQDQIAQLLNRGSHENASNTPDFVLAGFLQDALNAFNNAVNARSRFYSQDSEEKDVLEVPRKPDEIVLDEISDFAYKFDTPKLKDPRFAEFCLRVYDMGRNNVLNAANNKD